MLVKMVEKLVFFHLQVPHSCKNVATSCHTQKHFSRVQNLGCHKWWPPPKSSRRHPSPGSPVVLCPTAQWGYIFRKVRGQSARKLQPRRTQNITCIEADILSQTENWGAVYPSPIWSTRRRVSPPPAVAITELLNQFTTGEAHSQRHRNFQHSVCRPCQIADLDMIIHVNQAKVNLWLWQGRIFQLETFDEDFGLLVRLLGLEVRSKGLCSSDLFTICTWRTWQNRSHVREWVKQLPIVKVAITLA